MNHLQLPGAPPRDVYIDAFDRGKILTETETTALLKLNDELPAEDAWNPVSDREVVLRMLNNLTANAAAAADDARVLRYLNAALAIAPDAAHQRLQRLLLHARNGRREKAREDGVRLIEQEPPGMDTSRVQELMESAVSCFLLRSARRCLQLQQFLDFLSGHRQAGGEGFRAVRGDEDVVLQPDAEAFAGHIDARFHCQHLTRGQRHVGRHGIMHFHADVMKRLVHEEPAQGGEGTDGSFTSADFSRPMRDEFVLNEKFHVALTFAEQPSGPQRRGGGWRSARSTAS